jgi:16S rRNA processing protein RimM
MIEIARVLKPHGIRGDLKVRLFSDNLDGFAERGFAYMKKSSDYQRTAYTAVRIDAPFVYVHFDGVDTRNDAETLSGSTLYLRREDLETPDEGEHYVIDLIGLNVVDDEGNELGSLKEILQHGAADVYVVKGKRNFMFPALKRVIQKVDIHEGVIRVNAAALEEVAVYDDV